jgi:hypothetical protein
MQQTSRKELRVRMQQVGQCDFKGVVGIAITKNFERTGLTKEAKWF